MSAIKRTAELSKKLLSFLEERGYSHILSSGATETELGPDGGSDNYRLIPLKPDDPRLRYQETDYIISPISSTEAKEMAAGVDVIRFMIEIPINDYEEYLKQN